MSSSLILAQLGLLPTSTGASSAITQKSIRLVPSLLLESITLASFPHRLFFEEEDGNQREGGEKMSLGISVHGHVFIVCVDVENEPLMLFTEENTVDLRTFP